MPSRQWTLAQRRRATYNRKYSRVFRRTLNRQIIPVLKALTVLSYPKVISNLDKLIKADPIKKDFTRLYIEVAPRFARLQYNELKGKSYQQVINNTKDAVEDQWIADIREFINTQSGGRITSITDSSYELCLKLLQDELKVLFDEGLGVPELTRKLHTHLKKQWPKYQRYRAERIARTEILTASNHGQFMGADATEYPLLKKWIATADTRTRDVHMGMLSHPLIPKDDDFDVGGEMMQYPGAPTGSAANVINCRCTVAFQVVREE